MKAFLLFILLFPLFPFRGRGQTRFYLTQLTPAITTIAPNAAWNITTGNLVWSLNTYYDRSAATTVSTGLSGSPSPAKMLGRQLISGPLSRQTINCNLSMQQMFRWTSATLGGTITIYIRIINPNGSIATEVGSTNSAVSQQTTATNASLNFSVSNVSVLTGQRICIDDGVTYTIGSSSVGGRLNFQATTTADLPMDNTTTTVLNPWIQFSQTLKFQNQSNFFF